VERLEARLRDLRDRIVAAQTEQSDIEREQRKSEADVEQVRQRARRDQQRLDTGQVGSPKELEGLQHEIATLARRQTALEDIELEIMERLEDVEKHLASLVADQGSVTAEHAEALTRRDGLLGEISAEEAAARNSRGVLAGQIAPDLMALYEKVRDQQGGTGAAALQHRRCQGCRLELNTVDMNRIIAAPEDEVLRCEECRRILIRTPDSGL
jgi:predicted  nucleic acid-binding Zn-ribbon protein